MVTRRPSGGTRDRRGTPVPEPDDLFLRIFEQSPVGKILCDAAGRITSVNRAALEMFGITDAASVRGLHLYDDPNFPAGIRARVEAGENVRFETDYDFEEVARSGRYPSARSGVMRIDTMISPIVSGTGGEITGYLAQVQDVTALEEGARKLELLFDLLPVGISVIDAQGAVKATNPALQKTLGLSVEEIERGMYRRRRYLRADGTAMPPEEFPSAIAFRERRVVPSAEIGVVREDGSLVWTSVSAAPFPFTDWSVAMTVVDITARVEAERILEATTAELARQRGFFRALFDANPSGLMVVDEGMKVEAVNAVLARQLGVGSEEASGRPIGRVLRCARTRSGGMECGGDRLCASCQVRDIIRNALAGGRPFRNRAVLEHVGQAGRPERLVFLVSALPMRHEDQSHAMVFLEDVTELSTLRHKVRKGDDFAGMIGRDPAMLEVFESITDVARADVPVLIEGESGTGKELVASAIHRLSRRASGPFVPVSCGSLPESLLESELFGHVKGAFTGAIRDKKGRFELAAAGTIFLDEIGELSASMQVKLLRVLQERTFERVGGERTLTTDARVISATNRNLRSEVAAGRFREDLFYRLAVMPITVPPLRGRPGDIPLLAREFLADYAVEYGAPPPTLAPESLALLQHYRWPGNVRELQNALRYAVIKAKGPVIVPEHLPPSLRSDGQEPPRRPAPGRLTHEAVGDALRRAGGNRSRAAKLLGISRATLYRLLAKSGT